MLYRTGGLWKTFLWLFLFCGSVAALTGWLVWELSSKRVTLLESQVIEAWQQSLAHHQNELSRIERESYELNKTLARRFGVMGARILRLEALGLSISDQADVEVSELNFDEPPAFGGPELAPQRFNFSHIVGGLEKEIAQREDQLRLLERLLREREQDHLSLPMGRPVKRGKGWLSSRYGNRVDPFTGQISRHEGLDFAGSIGWPVIATAAGVVTYAGPRAGYGLLVEVNHGNGYITRYAHHNEILVETGSIVDVGTVVATMGNSGRSTGPHTHYEVLKDGEPMNPERLIKLKRR